MPELGFWAVAELSQGHQRQPDSFKVMATIRKLGCKVLGLLPTTLFLFKMNKIKSLFLDRTCRLNSPRSRKWPQKEKLRVKSEPCGMELYPPTNMDQFFSGM